MEKQLERVLILSCGSRGDCQPYVAVALGLMEAGYTVRYSTCIDHKVLVESHGISFHATFPSAEEQLRENEQIVKSRNEGDAQKFFKGMADAAKVHARQSLENFKALVDEFKPDLIIIGSLCEYFGMLSSQRLKIPTLPLFPHGVNQILDPARMIWGLPRLPFGLNRWFFKRMIFYQSYETLREMDDHAQEIFGVRCVDGVPRELLWEGLVHPDTPRLIAEGPMAQKVLYDHLPYHHNNRFVGTPVMSKEVQLRSVKGGDGAFGSDSSLSRMKDFLARSGRPVYMGWGSLTCKTSEYMVRLVLEALRLSASQAIISSGWAGLSLDLLDQKKDAAIIKYAEANALFVKEVPHEWLFPQCSCIVHHGGAGTTAAALRAKVPSVITPVFLDQFDHAYVLNQLGAGVGLGHFQKLSSKDIGDAIAKCTSDASMALRAQEVGEVMLSENATERVLQEVKDFWRDWVQTGRYVAARNRHLAKCQAAATGGCCKFF